MVIYNFCIKNVLSVTVSSYTFMYTNNVDRRYYVNPNVRLYRLCTPKYPHVDNFFVIEFLNTSLQHLIPSSRTRTVYDNQYLMLSNPR